MSLNSLEFYFPQISYIELFYGFVDRETKKEIPGTEL
jgi:hypothetical protein